MQKSFPKQIRIPGLPELQFPAKLRRVLETSAMVAAGLVATNAPAAAQTEPKSDHAVIEALAKGQLSFAMAPDDVSRATPSLRAESADTEARPGALGMALRELGVTLASTGASAASVSSDRSDSLSLSDAALPTSNLRPTEPSEIAASPETSAPDTILVASSEVFSSPARSPARADSSSVEGSTTQATVSAEGSAPELDSPAYHLPRYRIPHREHRGRYFDDDFQEPRAPVIAEGPSVQKRTPAPKPVVRPFMNPTLDVFELEPPPKQSAWARFVDRLISFSGRQLKNTEIKVSLKYAPGESSLRDADLSAAMSTLRAAVGKVADLESIGGVIESIFVEGGACKEGSRENGLTLAGARQMDSVALLRKAFLYQGLSSPNILTGAKADSLLDSDWNKLVNGCGSWQYAKKNVAAYERGAYLDEATAPLLDELIGSRREARIIVRVQAKPNTGDYLQLVKVFGGMLTALGVAATGLWQWLRRPKKITLEQTVMSLVVQNRAPDAPVPARARMLTGLGDAAAKLWKFLRLPENLTLEQSVMDLGVQNRGPDVPLPVVERAVKEGSESSGEEQVNPVTPQPELDVAPLNGGLNVAASSVSAAISMRAQEGPKNGEASERNAERTFIPQVIQLEPFLPTGKKTGSYRNFFKAG